MDQISGTTPPDPPTQAQDQSQPAQPVGGTTTTESPAPTTESPASATESPASGTESPGFRSRGRARRRARFLRKARELAYRDLGGLVFNLHRFGQRNDALVLAKLTTIGHIDAELRALEGALGERRPVTVLREAGITACPRCAAIHSSEDGFCPNCGLPMSRRVDLPADFQSASGPATPATAAHATAAASAVPATESQPVQAPPAAAAPGSSAPSRDSTPSGGRSPTPPPSAGGPVPAPAARAPSDPPAGDRPTEIIRPPVAGS